MHDGGDQMTKSVINWRGDSEDASGEDHLSKNCQPVRGVLILGFQDNSEAKKVGLLPGDVIIQYDGIGDLTKEKLAGIAETTRSRDTKVPLLVVRNGLLRSLSVMSGSLGVRMIDTAIQIGSQANTHATVKDEKPLFTLKYRGHKVTLRAIVCIVLLPVYGAMFNDGLAALRSGSELLRAILFLPTASILLLGSGFLLIDAILLREIRGYNDRMVKVWRLPGPVEVEVSFKGLHYTIIGFHWFRHKYFFDEHTSRFLRSIRGIYYDECLADPNEAKKLNLLLADLSG